MKQEEATKVIALALGAIRGLRVPGTVEWAAAKGLAERIEAAGHIKYRPEVEQEELTVYGYAVVGRDGRFIEAFPKQQEAIDYAASWDPRVGYRVATIVDQGGL